MFLDDMISIDYLKNMEMRVGKILEVRDHEGTKKPMYVLSVDFGKELGARTIVAGIKPFYTKEELLNKRVICVVNLEPREIAGIESNGMILAAECGDRVALLVPDRELDEGSLVH